MKQAVQNPVAGRPRPAVASNQRGSFLHPRGLVQIELIGQQIMLPGQSASDTQG